MIGRAPKTLIMLISPVDTLLMNALQIKEKKSNRERESYGKKLW